MTKGTRYFIWGALATLGIGLSVGLVAYYAGFPLGARSQADDLAELQYVPRDADVVAYANVRDVMDSELRQRLRTRESGAERDGQAEFQKRTGINIETDVDRVVAYMTHRPGEASSENGLVLARGRFDTVRLEGLAREHGGTVEDYKGKRVLTHRGDSTDKDMAVAFLEAGLVAVGSDRVVRQAIDVASGGQNVTANGELMSLVQDLDDGNAWAVGRFDALTSSGRLPEGVLTQLPAISWISASGRVNGGVTATIRAETRDDAAADSLRDVVRGIVALAELQGKSQPGVDTVLRSVQLGGTGRTVSLSFTVPAEVFEAVTATSPGSPQP